MIKAIFAAGATNNEDSKKLIDEYNQLLSDFNDELDPSKVSDRKRYAENVKERVKSLSGLTMQDMFKGKKLELGNKPKKEFSKTFSTKDKNWGKVK